MTSHALSVIKPARGLRSTFSTLISMNGMENGMESVPSKVTKSRDILAPNYRRTRLALLVFKTIGLAPLNIANVNPTEDSSHKNGSWSSNSIKFVYARSDWVYTILRVIVLCGLSSISVPRLFRNVYAYKSKLTTTIEVTEAIIGIALSNALWLLMCLRREKMAGLLNRMTSCEMTIGRFLESRKSSLSSFFAISVFLAIVIIWIAIIVTDCLAYASTIIDWFNDILPGFIISVFIIQYAFMVKYIEMQFRNLNRAIINTSRCSIVGRTFRSLIQGNPRIVEYDVPLTKIIDYRRTHTDLYEIANGVSEFYGLPMLFTISLCNFEIIYNSYYVIMPFILDVDGDQILIVVNGSLWLFALILPIAVLAKAVDNTIDEMRRTAEAIHKVFERSNISREDKAELKQFSIELLQRKVNFTAYGLFPLNCTLLHSMFSTVVTYIVILFQFQISASKYQPRSA